MKIKIKIAENRMPGLGRFVRLASTPGDNLIPETDRCEYHRELWLPDGSEVWSDEIEGDLAQTPDGKIYPLIEALAVFGVYGGAK